MKSSELFALSNLDGWRIVEGYFIELKHGLMGTFPALISETGKDFVCLSEEDVKKAFSLLPKRPYIANNMLLLINEKEKVAFLMADVEGQWKNNFYQKNLKPKYRRHYDSESARILTKEDLENMKVGDLKWAPGLVGPGMSSEEFKETLDFAAGKRE